MEFDEYQKAAKRTLYGNEQVLTNCALGLAGETGQVVDRHRVTEVGHVKPLLGYGRLQLC